MSVDTAEAVLADFVDQVLDRLSRSGQPETGAALRWRRVQASRASGEAASCEAAGGLGLDPYAIPDDVATFIEGAEHLFDGETLTEFVSGAASVRQTAIMDWVQDAVTRHGPSDCLAVLRPAAGEVAGDDPLRPSA